MSETAHSNGTEVQGLEMPSPVISRSEPYSAVPASPRPTRTVLEQSKWMPDDEASVCCKCGSAFGLFNRRHHCRKCGKIFCDKCSTHTLMLLAPTSKAAIRARVCDECYMNFYPKRPAFYTINHLPADSLSNIFSFLDVPSAVRCSTVSKQWREVYGSSSAVGRQIGARLPYYELWPHFEWGQWLHEQEKKDLTASGKIKPKEAKPAAEYSDPTFDDWLNTLYDLAEQRQRWLKGETRKVVVDNGAFVRSLSVSGEAAVVGDNTGVVTLWHVPTGKLLQKFHHLGVANQNVKIDVTHVKIFEQNVISASSRGIVFHRTAASGAALDAPPVALLPTAMPHSALDISRLYAAALPVDGQSTLHVVDLATGERSAYADLPEIHGMYRFMDSPPLLMLGSVGAAYLVDTRDLPRRSLVRVFDSGGGRTRITTLTAPEGTSWHPADTAYCVHREDLLQLDFRGGISGLGSAGAATAAAGEISASESNGLAPPPGTIGAPEVRLRGVRLSPFAPAIYADQVKICMTTETLELVVHEAKTPGAEAAAAGSGSDKLRWASRGRVGQRRMVGGCPSGLVAVSQAHLHFLKLKEATK